MGGENWSDDSYKARELFRAKTREPVFGYSAKVASGAAPAKSHESLDASLLKGGVRESRDSDKHPESNAVFVGFDVTGSMREVPQMLQKSLCTMMGLLLRKSYLTDPAICIAGIGDATCDKAPFQVGQFESGIEIENDLTKLYLEGGGGGQQTESYELALYFLARKTAIDCFEKRGRRGYAFIIGDEMAYKAVDRHEVKAVFGDTLQADIPLAEILAEAKKKWEIFYILPKMTAYYDEPHIIAFWKNLLNQNAMKLEDPNGISEMIASTIGLSEGAVDTSILTKELTDAGTTAGVADAVTRALVPVGAGKTDVALTKGTGLASL